MIRNTIAIFFLVFLGTLSLTSCGRQEKEKKRDRSRVALNQKKFKTPKPVSHDYVGSEACRECHADIMKEYESHPMSRSMSVTLASEIEDYEKAPEFAAGPNASYAVTRDPKKIEHRETITDSRGQSVSEHGETIDFTCGSGERGCSYFVFREGKLFQSPVTWYAKRGKWDLSPGYDPKHHPRFERMASDGCLACHAGRMNPVENERSTFDAKTPFHELSIGCERCHGPAKSHIEFHQSKSTGSGKKDPIVNPVKLAPELRDAVCYQCHLQGKNRVARYGRTEYDFRPGMHVSDVWITFLKSGATSEGKADAVSQVEQMQQSECFIQSQGGLGCISCHDPHRSPSADQRVDFYRNQCTKCHSEETGQTECSSPLDERTRKSPTDSCIRCHMPKLNAGDVPHTPQTDHRVQVPGDSFEYRDDSEDGFRIWNDRKVPNHAIERAKTIASAEQAFMMSDIQKADRALEGLRYFHPVAKDDLPLQEALAQLYSTKGDPVEADRIWSGLIKVFPRDEFLLTQVSLALHQTGKFKESYPYYRQLLRVNNSRPQVLMRYLDVCTKLAKFEEGMKIAERILELDPGSKVIHQWLARAYETAGDQTKASHHADMAKKLPARQ